MVRGLIGASTLLVVLAASGCASGDVGDSCSCQYPASPSSSEGDDRGDR